MTTNVPLNDYSREALARLALSVAAGELANEARGLVRPDADDHASEGNMLRRALRLLAAAHGVLERAAILERERGVSWRVFGDEMRVSKQAAQQRFAACLEQWETALDEPPAPPRRQLPGRTARNGTANDPRESRAAGAASPSVPRRVRSGRSA